MLQNLKKICFKSFSFKLYMTKTSSYDKYANFIDYIEKRIKFLESGGTLSGFKWQPYKKKYIPWILRFRSCREALSTDQDPQWRLYRSAIEYSWSHLIRSRVTWLDLVIIIDRVTWVDLVMSIAHFKVLSCIRTNHQLTWFMHHMNHNIWNTS